MKDESEPKNRKSRRPVETLHVKPPTTIKSPPPKRLHSTAGGPLRNVSPVSDATSRADHGPLRNVSPVSPNPSRSAIDDAQRHTNSHYAATARSLLSATRSAITWAVCSSGLTLG